MYTYNGTLFSLKQEGNPVICSNVDKTGRHYGKWNKPEKERQRLPDITYVWNLELNRDIA